MKSISFISLLLSLGLPLLGAPQIESFTEPYPTFGTIHRFDPAFDQLVAPEAQPVALARGFNWSEGPAWDQAQQRLLFSDVPENTAYQWTEEKGVSIFLRPSGLTGYVSGTRGGSNGLAFAPDGRLVLCQHGDRRLAVYDETTHSLSTLADRCGDRLFYSPNDLVFGGSGALFFTDPPWGYAEENRKGKDLNYVYRLGTDGSVVALIDSISYPNGIGLSPDQRTLYVGSTRPIAALWGFPLDADGNVSGEGVQLFDADARKTSKRGGRSGCDGMAIDQAGNIWTTGPSGVWVLRPDGHLLGHIELPSSVANCAFGGPDGTTLYMTADDTLARLPTLSSGLRFDQAGRASSSR